MSGRWLYIPFGLSIWLGSCKAQSVAVDKSAAEYAEAVDRALHFQIRADSLQRATEARVAALADTPEAQKADARIAIRDSDAQATATQKEADEWFARAGEFEQRFVAAPVSKPEQDNNIEVKNAAGAAGINDTPAGEFAIRERSPYSADNPIPVDAALPDGVAYKIQLGAFSKPLAANTFKGLTPISAEKLPGGITKYFVGLFRKFAAAAAALREVHEYGYKDAYIAAFYNRKTITPERAKQLENK